MTIDPERPVEAQPEQPCTTCNGALWVADGEPDRGALRTPGAGLIPCPACNEGGWDGPEPYSGWPGRCREYACDDAVHPCSLYHDPMACERPIIPGCGCDLEGLVDRKAILDQDDDGPAFHGDLVPEAAPRPPAPRPFPLTPIHDQLVAERTYPELT